MDKAFAYLWLRNRKSFQRRKHDTLVICADRGCCSVWRVRFYGRWLANKWGIDQKAKTPAVEFNDGKDFVPTNGWTVFSHQFSSIAGAGVPTSELVQFKLRRSGWLPVLLWC